MKKNTPKIGIVSGIGPLAGSDVFARMLKHAASDYGAVEDSEYPDMVLINHGVRGVDNQGSLSPEFEAEITTMVKQLEDNHTNIIGMACNTAHIYLDKIKTKPSTTLVNLIDEVAKEASKTKASYLLLTSTASKEQNLYQAYLDKYNVQFQLTNKKQQEHLDEVIGHVMAYRLKKAGELMSKVISSLSNTGLNGIIIGCTELPIAWDNMVLSDVEKELNIVSSNDILAKAMLKTYYSMT